MKMDSTMVDSLQCFPSPMILSRYLVVIVDPGIKIESGYKPYDDGLSMDIFIKARSRSILHMVDGFLQNRNNDTFIGKVWPGLTAFPDFFHPKANQYWQTQVCHGSII